MWEKFAPSHRSRDRAHACAIAEKRNLNGILWEMSELIAQQWMAIGSSNLVQGLTTCPAMYDH